MSSVTNLAKTAAAISLEKQAIWGSLAGGAAKLGGRMLPGFLRRGAATVGKRSLQGVGQAAGQAAKATGQATRTGLGWAAKQPAALAKDVSKVVPQAMGAARSVVNPKQSFNYYRNAGNGGVARNMLRDVAGSSPTQNTTVIGDMGRAAWNTRIPTVRSGGQGAGIGQGTGIGRIGWAKLVGTGAAGAYGGSKIPQSSQTPVTDTGGGAGE